METFEWTKDPVASSSIAFAPSPTETPQLASGLAFALPADTKSGWVRYDDCREATGGMIEAKGNYTEMLSSFPGRMWLEEDWIRQAENQISGAKSRTIDWYFHDPAAADFARLAFEGEGIGDRIGIHVLPFPDGVPRFNPRVR